MKKARIIKVSGPLVVAENMTDVRMHDVVFVGEEKIIGEIVELKEDKASIQVYEETSGIAPGEPVVSTGMPLAVELAPGLISSIYDGIQRPLNIIREKAGDYITRGINIPGIDHNKKWSFKVAVKKQDKVTSGDLLGTVQETSLIMHKVMVPHGIEGEIITISDGEFTVDETIAEIKPLKNSKHKDTYKVSMLQKWPVRQGRPYREKLSPRMPLVTGQRVIDTFFPIAKGGTACIPGPFGSGKCVTGDTPVLLADGCLKSMKNIFLEFEFKGEKIKNSQEEYTILSNPFEVFAGSAKGFHKSKVRTVYKGKTEKLIRIKTRTGRIAEITPVHKLPKFNDDLNICLKEAKDLKVGDYLALPRKINFKGKIQSISIGKIFPNQRIVNKKIIDKIPILINELASKHGNKKKVAHQLGISYDVLIGYFLKKNKPTVTFVEKIYLKAREKLPKIKYIKGEKNSKIVRVPEKFSKEMAIFLGLVLGDGMIKQNSVRFYNNDEKMLNLFEDLLYRLFSLKAKRTLANKVKCSMVESSILVKFLKYFGYPEYKKSRGCFVPESIFRSSASVFKPFLGAYFACDGYFHEEKAEIEYSTASKEMQKGLSYLFLRLGIVVRTKEKIYKGFRQFRLFISGRDEVKKFFKSCQIKNISKFNKIKRYLSLKKRGYTSIDIVPLGTYYLKSIYERAKKPYKKLKEKGIEIHNYLSGEFMSKSTFKKFAHIMNFPRLMKFATNDLEHIYCDRIIEVKEINSPCDVYDIEVPDGHNFIGGNFAMIYSNTVVLHQLAKWSDADIIVYVGCGERGNEMTDVLLEFPALKDPKSGEPLIKRTVLIANTSNMPVAAREASIYTGITIAEYYRDMGYNVALMADSTSRWAEALREMSGRLEEMPGEEGYPAYMGTRIAEFYERAGYVKCLGNHETEGTLSIMGAVSPPGGDLSDPVVQVTLRMVQVFWGLEDRLAYMRHFPAINWLRSYSLYLTGIREFMAQEIASDFLDLRNEAMKILQEEASLEEIVRLVGLESLSPQEKLVLETAKSIREDFLHQHAFDEIDTYTSLSKQYRMIKIVIMFHECCKKGLEDGVSFEDLMALKIRERIAKIKFISEKNIDEFDKIEKELHNQISQINKKAVEIKT